MNGCWVQRNSSFSLQSVFPIKKEKGSKEQWYSIRLNQSKDYRAYAASVKKKLKTKYAMLVSKFNDKDK